MGGGGESTTNSDLDACQEIQEEEKVQEGNQSTGEAGHLWREIKAILVGFCQRCLIL